MKPTLIISLLLALSMSAWAAAPALKVISSGMKGSSLVQNGDFETSANGELVPWRGASQGFDVAIGEGRAGSQALRVHSPSGKGWYGASQTITLNRATGPIVVRGWSKADNVSGGADNNYSLYVDLIYADGTPLWGQTGNFRCGTHDWEARQFILLPEKPIKTITLHCLFRGHGGKAWFDDVSVEEIKASGRETIFQGLPVRGGPFVSPAGTLGTDDGLAVILKDREIVSLKIDGRELAHGGRPGFMARDAAAKSDFFALETLGSKELDLVLPTFSFTRGSNHLAFEGRITSRRPEDRAVTLVYSIPVSGSDWQWGDDIRRSRITRGGGEFVNQVAVRCGSTGTLSLYPVAAIWNERCGLAIGLDMARPAIFRVGYHGRLKTLFLAYDFGLVADTEQFPSSADFRFVLYTFDPKWGFRAAWQKYMEIFPDHFLVRAKDQGLWMPFTDVSTVEGWQDFGFKFHEGSNNVPWDDEHGVLSFRYTEPMTWWMPMPKGTPRTRTEASRIRDELAKGKNDRYRRMAQVSRACAMYDESGNPSLVFRDTPWCDGAVWSLNPNPYLGSTAAEEDATQTPDTNRLTRDVRNAATVYWNPSIKKRLYGPDAKGRLDGEYLDSLEGYVTAHLNSRREHFRQTTVPLTFDTATRQPALSKGLAVFEFTKWMADDVHGMGKLMFANSVPYRFTFLCPWLDVMGTETDWLRAGQYQPPALAQTDLWRTLSGEKPYLLLMNTDYDQLTPDLVERYFQRALFYGMFPGMFSHNASENPYWKNPKWYNRDRHLFKKYMPVIKRVAEAGWQPVTRARCDNSRLLVERFGAGGDKTVFFTVYNNTDADQTGLVKIEFNELRLADKGRVVELLSGQPIEAVSNGYRINLRAYAVIVLAIRIRGSEH